MITSESAGLKAKASVPGCRKGSLASVEGAALSLRGRSRSSESTAAQLQRSRRKKATSSLHG